MRGLERLDISEISSINLGDGRCKSIDVRIARLRKKLTSIGCAKCAIETIRSFGYWTDFYVQLAE